MGLRRGHSTLQTRETGHTSGEIVPAGARRAAATGQKKGSYSHFDDDDDGHSQRGVGFWKYLYAAFGAGHLLEGHCPQQKVSWVVIDQERWIFWSRVIHRIDSSNWLLDWLLDCWVNVVTEFFSFSSGSRIDPPHAVPNGFHHPPGTAHSAPHLGRVPM